MRGERSVVAILVLMVLVIGMVGFVELAKVANGIVQTQNARCAEYLEILNDPIPAGLGKK